MYLRYGSYIHTSNEVEVTISHSALFNQRQVFYGVKHTWEIKGELRAASQALLSLAIVALEAAYSVNYQDLGLYTDSGSLTAHYLSNATTRGGVRVISLRYPKGNEGEYSLWRSYEITIEAETPEAVDPANQDQGQQPEGQTLLQEWNETLSLSGGGPRRVFQQPLVGPAQKQVVATQTTFKARQSGSATGLNGYPAVPAPKFPADEHEDQREIVYESPTRIEGPAGAFFQNYKLTWSYQFESVDPLIGRPSKR